MSAGITTLLDAAALYLGDAEFFAAAPAIPVYAENRLDIQAVVRDAVGKIGACVIVAAIAGAVASPNLKGPRFEPLQILAAVYENVTINRSPAGTRQPAVLIAQAVVMLLHHWKPAELPGATMVVTGIQIEENEGILTYLVRAEIPMGLDPQSTTERI